MATAILNIITNVEKKKKSGFFLSVTKGNQKCRYFGTVLLYEYYWI